MKNLKVIDLWKDNSKINKFLSTSLIDAIEKNIISNKKVLLYINKKWEYSSVVCNKCQYIYKCPKCDITLTKYNNNILRCSYCSYSEQIETKCKKCKNNSLIYIWIWTEQIENHIKKLFTKSNIYRFDASNIKNIKDKKEANINIELANIIIWTKMITTWFNIKNLWLIWIILIEQELQIPEYNTEEKVYQNIKQLIWRWWRVNQETDIYIQTFIPENSFIKTITTKNYKDFIIQELEERKIFNYPPYCELKTIKYKNANIEKSIDFINKLEKKLKEIDVKKEYSIESITKPIKRNNQYHTKIIIKWTNIDNLLFKIKNLIFQEKNLSIY